MLRRTVALAGAALAATTTWFLPAPATATPDVTAPTATIALSDTSLRIGDTSTVTISFDERVTTFTQAYLTVDNGAVTPGSVFSADGGLTWQATITPAPNVSDATNVVTVDNTQVADAAGNHGLGTTVSPNYSVDTQRPTASLAVAPNLLRTGSTSTVTITFSEAVTGFTTADMLADNGTVSSLSSSDGGITWTATLTPDAGVADPSNLVSLDLTGVADQSGNAGTGTADSNNYEVDTVRPAATSIVVADTSLRAGETSVVTFTFSEAVTGFTAADATVGNGSLSGLSSSDSGTTWTATLTPTAGVADATNVVRLDNTGFFDAAGNPGTGTTDSNNYAVSTVRPTVSLVVLDPLLTIGQTSLVTITFSEAVTGFTNADLTVANGSLSAVSSSDGGTTWTATLTPTAGVADPTNVVALDLQGVSNAAGNTGSGSSTSNNYAVDTQRPTATVVVADSVLRVGQTSVVTITFSEAVTGFTTADLTVQNGTLTSLSSSDGGITWTATLTPNAGVTDPSNLVSLDLTGVADQSGNAGTGTADSNNYEVDTVRPAATSIVVADTSLRAGETSVVTFTFSEAVTGFTAADATVGNGSLSGLSSSDGGITWTATLTPSAGVADATNVVTLDNTGFVDAAGNTGTGTTDSNNYAVSTVQPTASIALTDTLVGVGDTPLVIIVFSEAVTGFTKDDLTPQSGTLSDVSSADGGVTWTSTFTPTSGVTATGNTVVLDNAGVTGASGNSGTGTTSSPAYTVDTERPTVSVAVADPTLGIGQTSLVTFTFSEEVLGFSNADLTVPNGTLSAVSSSDGGRTWTATLTPDTATQAPSNTITLDMTLVVDRGANTGTGLTSSNTYRVDTVRPTASVVVEDTSLLAGETSQVTFTFSEAVTGFTAADAVVENGALSGLSSSDGGVTWTAMLTPTAGVTEATNVVMLDKAGVDDVAGNSGTGTASSNYYAIDTDRPTASVVVEDTSLLAGETLVVTVTFSEAVTGFTNADLTSEHATLAAVVSADGGMTWTAVLTPEPGTTDDTNVVTLHQAGVTDLAGNPGSGTVSSDEYAIDTELPTATIDVADAVLGIGHTTTVTLIFSEAVTGLAPDDVVAGSATIGAPTTSDGGTTWTATLTPLPGVTDATNTVALDETLIRDLAGNPGAGTTSSANYRVDTRAPRVRAAMGRGPVTLDLSAHRSLRLRFRVDEVVVARFRVTQHGTAVRSFGPQPGKPRFVVRSWSGRDDRGHLVRPGRYQARVRVVDAAGNQASRSVRIRVIR